MCRTLKYYDRKGMDTKYKRYKKRQQRKEIKENIDYLPRRPCSIYSDWRSPSDGWKPPSCSTSRMNQALIEEKLRDLLGDRYDEMVDVKSRVGHTSFFFRSTFDAPLYNQYRYWLRMMKDIEEQDHVKPLIPKKKKFSRDKSKGRLDKQPICL